MAIMSKFLKPVSQEEVDSVKFQTVGSLALAPVNVSAEVEVVSAEKVNIKTYFAAKGFDIQISEQSPCIGPVESLAFMVASNYRSCKLFLKHIRENVARKCFHINYSVSQLGDCERDAVVAIAEKFGEYGIISNMFYNRYTGFINGVVSSAPRVINFLNGDYLEFYGRTVVERVVKEAADRHNTDYEVYSNAIISKSGEKHELDIVFRVGENVFWSEIKSGKFSDFDCYRRLGVTMGVNPDRHILLAAEKETETAEVISWFYQFYVANIENFKDKVVEMIDKAF